jgi:hypothetical protein
MRYLHTAPDKVTLEGKAVIGLVAAEYNGRPQISVTRLP